MSRTLQNLEPLVALAKRRGFVFPGSDIYGGLKGTWDYGPLGVMLVNNLKREWWKHFVDSREDMYGLDAAILMNRQVWEASGHTGAGFADPMVEDTVTGDRFRADHLLAEQDIDAEGTSLAELDELIATHGVKSPQGNPLSAARNFNMMFESRIGATAGDAGQVYLRPETAQGIFVNFKNVVDTMNPKVPFGIAQIGKAFRNEIAPREWLFRVREFEQLEIEYFVKESDWQQEFANWQQHIQAWHRHIGLRDEHVREYEVPANDLAHYSKRTIDFEYDFPGKGFAELAGFAYRTDHDLQAHMAASGKSMEYIEPDGTRFVPHVLEPSFGLERMFAAVLAEAYTEDEMNGEARTYLQLPAHLAPYRAAISPLLKNKPALVEKAREVFAALKQQYGNVTYDENGNIGKRYRRQDEIGTPYCIVIDFATLGEEEVTQQDTVTVRHRDTGAQERVSISALIDYLT